MALLTQIPPANGGWSEKWPATTNRCRGGLVLFRVGRWWRLMLLLTVACQTAFLPRRATAGVATEENLKAVFLYNFAQLVDWPAGAFPSTDTPFTVGILGRDPFGAVLDDVLRNERLGDRPFVVKRFTNVTEVQDCQILFISRSEEPRLEKIFTHLRGQPVLTVGDIPGFATRGGMISILRERNKLRLRINLKAAQEAHLTISSKLLRLSDVVGLEAVK